MSNVKGGIIIKFSKSNNINID